MNDVELERAISELLEKVGEALKARAFEQAVNLITNSSAEKHLLPDDPQTFGWFLTEIKKHQEESIKLEAEKAHRIAERESLIAETESLKKRLDKAKEQLNAAQELRDQFVDERTRSFLGADYNKKNKQLIELAWKKFKRKPTIENAKQDTLYAEELLSDLVVKLVTDERLTKKEKLYLGTCLGGFVHDGIDAERAFNINKPEGRRPERNQHIKIATEYKRFRKDGWSKQKTLVHLVRKYSLSESTITRLASEYAKEARKNLDFVDWVMAHPDRVEKD